MSKFDQLSGETNIPEDHVEIESQWPERLEGARFRALTVEQLMLQLPQDTRWPEQFRHWDMLSEVYDVPGNRWVMGASEMEIDGVILVACYTLSAMKPDGSESNATHMDVEPLRAFLNTQPKRRRVVGVLDHGELRPMIGVHKISYSNGANRVFLQMGPAL